MIKNVTTNNKKVAFISSILIFLGVIFILYNLILTKKLYAFDYMNNLVYLEPVEVLSSEVETTIADTPSTIVPEKVVNNNIYIGQLEIPKINFKRGFLDNSSPYNNVDSNLFTVSSSTYPDQENNNLIIAGHSGTGPQAFFKNLYKLAHNDEAIINYKGKKYTYKITDIYDVAKIGKVQIRRDYSKNVLTLITCTFNNKSSQTVYILELVNIV